MRMYPVRSYIPEVRSESEGCFSNSVHSPTPTSTSPVMKKSALNRYRENLRQEMEQQPSGPQQESPSSFLRLGPPLALW